MNGMDYAKAQHIKDAVFYGIRPLDHNTFAGLFAEGIGLDGAFSIASDMQCGFTFNEAREAWLNSERT